MAHNLQLVSFELCPYVERSRIALLEKQVPHEVTFIDLDQKPDWFLAVSPLGRVPVLLVDGAPVFESMIINELIDELHPAPPLLPPDPLGRATARSWIVFANDAVFPASYLAGLALASGDLTAAAKPLQDLGAALGKVEARLAAGGAGPWFGGAAFSLVDAAWAPFLRRWRAVEAWGQPEARLLGRHPAVSAWAEVLSARPSVSAAEPADFAARYRQLCESRAARARAAAR